MQRKRGVEWHTSKRLKKCSKGRGSGAAQRGKNTTEWCMTRRVGTRSKRGE